MRKVIVFTNLTLDGVMQAPGRPDEDTRGGFPFGGWGASYNAMTSLTTATLSNVGPMLFGRRTYKDFYRAWANRTDNPFSGRLTAAHKYVASTTLQEPLPWANSTLLPGDATDAVARLKEEDGKDFMIMGSGELVQSLVRCNLVDRFVLLIHPLVLGTGRQLFPEGGASTNLELLETQTAPNGVVLLVYQPAASSDDL